MDAENPGNTKIVNLALQGGGAHGAFGWGVLDALIEDGRVEIDGLSATSAGAMNAAVYAYHKMTGGMEAARQGLEEFWRRVSHAGERLRGPFDGWLEGCGLGHFTARGWTEWMTRILSPYEFNPLNLNPLREAIEESVDFEALHACACTSLRICATNVRTGRLRIFDNPEVTADVVLASACLPHLFQAVEIEGEHYWDGGYIGNPAIFPLFEGLPSRDIVVIHLNPIARPDLPRSAPEIMNRINEISFNSSLLREMRAIDFVSELLARGWVKEEHREKLPAVRMHSIRDDAAMARLGVASKTNTDWAFLTGLRDRGRETAFAWLEANYAHIGVRSSVDLAAEFL